MVHCLRFVFELMDDLHLLFFEGLQRQFYKDRLTESSSYAHGCHICAMGSDHSTKKTKVLVVGRDAAEQLPNAVIAIRGELLEVVSQFKYLGSMFTSDGMLDTEIAHRVC
jgi:hypothetical protein